MTDGERGTAGRPRAGWRWYLSFDCATKSLAHALLRVAWLDAAEVARVEAALARARALLDAAAPDPGALRAAARGLARTSAALAARFELRGGGACDLFPGTADRDVSTVQRVRAIERHLSDVVDAGLAAAGAPGRGSPALNVAVEYQMAPNDKSRKAMVAIVAHYAAANVYLVGPALKNGVAVPSRPDLARGAFLRRYAQAYGANKAHSRALYFGCVAPAFGHALGRGGGVCVARRFAADFADSVLQVVGHARAGPALADAWRAY